MKKQLSIVLASLVIITFVKVPVFAGNLQQNKYVETFIISGWNINLGHSVEETKNIFGKPLNEKVVSENNPYEKGQTDHIYKLDYGGLKINIYRIEGKQKVDKYIGLSISDPKYKFKYNIKIGSNKTNVINILGKPNMIKNETFIYQGESASEVKLYFKNNKIIKAEWEWPLD